MSGHWVYGAIGLLVALHLVALVRADRKGTESERAERGSEGDTSSQGAECPDCGVVNDERYRFCKQCVSELPGQASVLEATTGPAERRTL